MTEPTNPKKGTDFGPSDLAQRTKGLGLKDIIKPLENISLAISKAIFLENKLQNFLSFSKSKTLFIFGGFIPNLDKTRSFISFM